MSALVVLLILGIAGATFVVSYAGVRDLAIGAGVPWRLARLYPAILDGVLVVACAAAYLLRDDTSVWRRLYAWTATAVLVGLIGAADAIHAMNVALPHRTVEGTIAALPWAVVMLGFSLWLTMLRYARAREAAPAPVAPALTSSQGAETDDAGLDLALGIVAESRDPSRAPAISWSQEPPEGVSVPGEVVAVDEADEVGAPGAADVTAAVDTGPLDSGLTTAAAVEPASPADVTEPADLGASPAPPASPEQAGGPAPAESTGQITTPKLYRVRSTPVPPAD